MRTHLLTPSGLMAALLGLVLAACSDRARENPLDPLNPETEGRLAILNAVAGDGRVRVEWDSLPFTDIIGLEVWRFLVAPSDTLLLTAPPLPPTRTSLVDSSVMNGATYGYFLSLVLGTSPERPTSNADTTTPGPDIPWVADLNAGTLSLLSPDGRDRVFETSSLAGPRDLAIDPRDGSIWVADFLDSSLRHFGPTGARLGRVVLAGRPRALALDTRDGSLWATQINPPGLAHFSTAGEGLDSLLPLPEPEALALDEVRGLVWVALPDSGQVARVERAPDRGLVVHTIGGFQLPAFLAVDPVRGFLWVADPFAARLHKLDSQGQRVAELSAVQTPQGLVVDPRDGSLIVADRGRGAILRLTDQGELRWVSTGLARPFQVALVETGEVWATDLGAGEVLKLTATGTLVARLGGFSQPWRIQIAPRSR